MLKSCMFVIYCKRCVLRILPKLLKTQAQAFCCFLVQSSIPWHRLLTRRLNARTKLVGPVISCEGAPFKGQAPSKWRDSPAVQSYAIALDQVKFLKIPVGHLCWQPSEQYGLLPGKDGL